MDVSIEFELDPKDPSKFFDALSAYEKDLYQRYGFDPEKTQSISRSIDKVRMIAMKCLNEHATGLATKTVSSLTN